MCVQEAQVSGVTIWACSGVTSQAGLTLYMRMTTIVVIYQK